MEDRGRRQVTQIEPASSLPLSEERAPASGAIPTLWIPKAARLPRPGGQLIFLANSALLMLTTLTRTGYPPPSCCGPTSECTALTDQTTTLWSSTSATAT